jgi:hypothetical protein
MQVAYLLGKTRSTDRQTGIVRPTRCSSVALDSEGNLKMATGRNFRASCYSEQNTAIRLLTSTLTHAYNSLEMSAIIFVPVVTWIKVSKIICRKGHPVGSKHQLYTDSNGPTASVTTSVYATPVTMLHDALTFLHNHAYMRPNFISSLTAKEF